LDQLFFERAFGLERRRSVGGGAGKRQDLLLAGR
jgi:hypothetical protein